MTQVTRELCSVLAELFIGCICSRAWFWCNKCNAVCWNNLCIFQAWFHFIQRARTERRREIAMAWCWSQGVQGSVSYLMWVCVCVNKEEHTCGCFLLPIIGDIFFSVRWMEVTTKSFSLPPSLSSLHNPFIFRPPCHNVSQCNFIQYYCQSLHFPSLLPTHMSILLYFTHYIFSFRPPSFSPVNLSLCCSNPHLSLSSFPESFPLSVLHDFVHISLTSSSLALSPPSLNPVSCPKPLNIIELCCFSGHSNSLWVC